MIGIIGAMKMEVDALVSRIQGARTENVAGVEYILGSISGKDVVVAACGVGKINAALCAHTMILRYQPAYIINSGVAGSLDSRLHICDVVLGESAVQHDVDTTALGDPAGFVSTVNRLQFPLDARVSQLLSNALNDLGVRYLHGVIATGDQFVWDKAHKTRIRETFGAVACEMEGCAIAHACCLSNVPCAILRAISDGADEDAGLSYAEFSAIAADQTLRVLTRFFEAYA